MPRESRKPDPPAGCPGFCLDADCPACWESLAKATSVEQRFEPVQPKPTKLVIDLDERTHAVLQRKAAYHRTPTEAVALVLLQEKAAGIAVGQERTLAEWHLSSDLEGRSEGRHR